MGLALGAYLVPWARLAGTLALPNPGFLMQGLGIGNIRLPRMLLNNNIFNCLYNICLSIVCKVKVKEM